MSAEAFMSTIVVASALLALWLSVRLPQLRPASTRGVVIAAGVGLATLALTPWLVNVVGQPLGALAAVFLVVLPAFTYLFLGSLWLLGYMSRLFRPF
jgi:hypothetical protein